jgi:hypothetical protein
VEVPLLVVVPRLVDPVLVDPVLVDPEPAVPVFVDPVLAGPLFPPPEVVPDGLVPAPPEPLPEPGELVADVAGAEVLLPGVGVLLPGAGEDEGAVALALAVLDGLAVGDRQPVPAALARVALVLAFADAVEVAVPVAEVLAVPAALVAVAVVLSPGLVPPPAGLPLVPLSVALLAGLLTGATLGVTDREAGVAGVADVAAAEDGEADTHGAVASWLLCAAEVPPGPAAPGAEPTWVPSPFVLGTPPPVLELEIPTAEPSWTKASRSGGTARATPMANTAQAAASAGRSSPYRQSRC